GGWTPPAHIADQYVELPNVRAADERKAIGKHLVNVARLRLGAQWGNRHLVDHMMGKLWNETKARFNIPKTRPMDKIDDLTLLAAMKRYVLGRAADEKQRRHTP